MLLKNKKIECLVCVILEYLNNSLHRIIIKTSIYHTTWYLKNVKDIEVLINTTHKGGDWRDVLRACFFFYDFPYFKMYIPVVASY